jgi:predicted DNA-binding transcriptional regulator YafY
MPAKIPAGREELRRDYRHFRVDRIRTLTILETCYPPDQGELVAGYRAGNRVPLSASTPLAADLR